ncbi:Ribosome biogenesis protein Kri1 [Coemansia thaxteri]|uniref:Ribosome biogenesis protein Kri1 n=1 Tax=Coemansia thaxteri TaxID=2663907 RepID=A0A9W8BGE9_9FUNG|nr:Ribosome biogenesis protein Kri1 [Coemansia thaxteri]
MSDYSDSGSQAHQVDLTLIDKKKLLRADERRRRAGDEFGDVESYLSESEKSGSEDSGDNSEDSSSESDVEEDENGELITPEIDAQIMKALSALRSKDKSIYDSSVQFFSDDAVKQSQETWKAKQKAARQASDGVMTLRDYQHKVMLEYGGVVDEDQEMKQPPATLTHVQEQEALKKEFKAAFGEDHGDSDADEEGVDFLVKKEKTKEEIAKEDVDYRRFLLDSMGGDAANKAALERWTAFTTDRESAGGKVDAGQAFLMNYVLNRGWVDKSAEKSSAELEAKAIVDKEEDEELMELTDKFESKYNFRFEEEGGAQIKSYPRVVEGSLRRKDERRKLARERAKERKTELKKQKAEELKQLKTQKKKSILDKLKEIQGITGNKTIGFDALDLDGDFDPEKFDSKMDELFGDNADEGDFEKPVWDDDIDIGDLVSDDDQPSSSSVRNKKGKSKKGKSTDASNVREDDDGDFIMDADYLSSAVAGPSTARAAAVDPAQRHQLKDTVSEYMDKRYQLDFEDIVGDGLATRFKYSKVKPVDYGLTPAEILLADDQFLNDYVSVKKIAPYRPDWKIDEDLAKYASKKRIIYVKKKAASRRSEWEQELKSLASSSSKKRAADPDTGKAGKSKRPKDEAKKSSDKVKSVVAAASGPPTTTAADFSRSSEQSTMAAKSATNQPEAASSSKLAEDSAGQPKNQTRHQRQRAKKAAAAASASASAAS